MKIRLIFITIFLASCTHNNFSGQVYDYETNLPIGNVRVSINNEVTKTDSSGRFAIKVNSNAKCMIYLEKEGYAKKEVLRKPDFSNGNQTKNKIYMFGKESDFSNKN
jgi:hypothetical protein